MGEYGYDFGETERSKHVALMRERERIRKDEEVKKLKSLKRKNKFVLTDEILISMGGKFCVISTKHIDDSVCKRCGIVSDVEVRVKKGVNVIKTITFTNRKTITPDCAYVITDIQIQDNNPDINKDIARLMNE